MNGNVFLAYVEQVLVPALRRATLSSWTTCLSGVREAIETTGARLMFLPPYSPDFRSTTPSQNSRLLCVPKPRGQSQPCGTPSDRSSTFSPQRKAGTNSRPPDMTRNKRDVL